MTAFFFFKFTLKFAWRSFGAFRAGGWTDRLLIIDAQAPLWSTQSTTQFVTSQVEVPSSSSIRSSYNHHFNLLLLSVTNVLPCRRSLGLLLSKGGYWPCSLRNEVSACSRHKGETSIDECWLGGAEKQSLTLSRPGVELTISAFTGPPARHANHWATTLGLCSCYPSVYAGIEIMKRNEVKWTTGQQCRIIWEVYEAVYQPSCIPAYSG